MSSARDEILAKVRAALDDVRPAGPLPAPPTISAADDLVALFVERVADYRALVTRCAGAEVGATVATIVAGCSVVVPAGLGFEVPGALVDDQFSADRLDAIAAVVTAARVGIAETGTVILDHTADQGRRAITLVPDLHVCVVRSDQIVRDVPDAIALLDPRRPLTWISGPSATSDIELSRVEGVHGPRTLHVVVVD